MKTIKPYLTAGFMCVALLMVVTLRQLVDGRNIYSIVAIGRVAQFGIPVETITDAEWERVKEREEARRNVRLGPHYEIIPPKYTEDPVNSWCDRSHGWVGPLDVELPPFETYMLQILDTDIQQGASDNADKPRV